MRADRITIADDAKGWLLPGEGAFLRELALECTGPFLEVGSYCGKSTVWLGDAAEACETVLFSVDHHAGSPEMAAGQDCHDPQVVDSDGAHDTLGIFRRTIRLAGLQDTVVPIVAATGVIGPYWTHPIGFAFIDAAHDYAGCKLDAATWGPWVTPGGIMAFHDTTIADITRVVDEVPGFVEVDGFGSIRVLVAP